MGAISSVFSLALLFYYSGVLALLVTAMLLLLAGANWVFALFQLRHDRVTFGVQGEVGGVMLQVIRSLAKLRVANAESFLLSAEGMSFDLVAFLSFNAVSGISFRARQGECVAFVGPSGCGKSTLYRLLLGFEKPDSGAIFLDGHSLGSLDLVQTRGTLGVVLQNGQVVPGTIFHNIAGMLPLSLDEAWEAARAAALDDDIRAMPMGMATILTEGGNTLSVGQRQRLLIARAVARKPRILLLDEATSALDNVAQAKVQRSLRKLGMTRLVIAHRLTSIQNAERIHVLDQGRIVESGTYRHLMQADGLFADLARRQLLE